MKKVKGFKCVKCGKEYRLNEVEYICKACGGNLQVVYDYKFIKKTVTKKYFEKNTDYTISPGSLIVIISKLMDTLKTSCH